MKKTPQYIEDARRRVTAGHADLEAALRYEDLARRAESPAKRAEYLQRAVEARAVGRRKLRSQT